MKKKAFISIPGHFIFCEQVRRDNAPEEERRRLQAMARQAIDNYFNQHSNSGDRYEQSSTQNY